MNATKTLGGVVLSLAASAAAGLVAGLLVAGVALLLGADRGTADAAGTLALVVAGVATWLVRGE